MQIRALLLASVAAVALSFGDARAADISVTPATLPAALAHAQGGDRLLLAPGTYSGLSLYHRDFGSGVVVSSADPAHRAVLTNFNIEAVQGLTFRQLDFKVLLPNYNAFNVYSSQHIAYDQVHVYGPPGAPDPDVQALNVFDSSSISFTNGEIEQVSHGLSVARSDAITVSGNHIHHVNSDTLDFVQVSNLLVAENLLHDFYPTDGNHPDAMQFGTANSITPSRDIVVRDNLIYRGDGQNTQGIFFSDELGTMPFANVSVWGNTVIGTGSSAIRATHNVGLTITGNELVTLGGGDPTPLLVQFSDQVSVSGNAAAALSVTATNGNSNITLGANTLTQPVTDGGLAAMQRFAAAHPTMAAVLAPLLPAPIADPRDALILRLRAQIAAAQAALAPPN